MQNWDRYGVQLARLIPGVYLLLQAVNQSRLAVQERRRVT